MSFGLHGRLRGFGHPIHPGQMTGGTQALRNAKLGNLVGADKQA